MDLNHLSRWLIYFGTSLVVFGFIIWLFSKFLPIKNIPGTLKIEMGGLTCIFPILASIVMSVILTIVINIILRLINK